jgi:death-on-curing protein
MAGLTVEDLVHIAERTVGADVRVRDLGLLSAALARMDASVFGEDVYPRTVDKAAALLHSLATTAPLVEGNRPFALAAVLAFLALNGQPCQLSPDAAVALVTDIVTGRWESVGEIAAVLSGQPPARRGAGPVS